MNQDAAAINIADPEPEKPSLRLVAPNTKVRLGANKYRTLKRQQDWVEIFAWGTVLAVTAMFLIDGGLASLTDTAAWMSAITRLTALVATDLLLIHMLLVARVPWIDKLYGHDRATLTHKKLGKPILYIVTVHVITSVIQYALLDGKNVFVEAFSMITTMQDMWTAAIGFALMLVVTVTSINAARRRLSYEAWYLIHVTSYVSVLVAIPHQFSTGSDIAGRPVQTIFWVSLYLFVAGNILWFRFAMPVVATLRHSFKVSNVVRESSDSVSVYIGGNKLEKLGGQAGQFYMLRVMTAKQWWRPHPFSISAAPNNEFVRFTIGARGDDTELLQNLKPGTRIALEGPYGVFTEERRTREKVVLLAAGIGAPPIRSLAESMAARPGDVTIIYRVRESEDAALLGELTEIARSRGFRMYVLEGKRGNPNSWLPAHMSGLSDHDRLTQMVPSVKDADVFVCGPAPWTRAVVKSLDKVGTPTHQIHAEEFAW
jgi:predicted ferric reductase